MRLSYSIEYLLAFLIEIGFHSEQCQKSLLNAVNREYVRCLLWNCISRSGLEIIQSLCEISGYAYTWCVVLRWIFKFPVC